MDGIERNCDSGDGDDSNFHRAESPGSGITVTATSKADTTKSAVATFGITDLAGVTTYHNDGARDGVNSQEYVLNTSNVKAERLENCFRALQTERYSPSRCGCRM